MNDPRMRVATEADLPALDALMDRAITHLQKGFLDSAQIEASRQVMGLDRQLVKDRTYWIAELDGQIAGCGGWSKRATLYGGDHSTHLREPRLLDPATEAARIRAMYTDPAFARRGVGKAVLTRCEDEARRAGFARVELMATLSGEPLYRVAGYEPIERVEDRVPLIRMGKPL